MNHSQMPELNGFEDPVCVAIGRLGPSTKGGLEITTPVDSLFNDFLEEERKQGCIVVEGPEEAWVLQPN